MTNLIQISEEQKKEVLNFLEINRFTNSYSYSIKIQEGDYNPYLERKPLIFEDQSESVINKALEDLEIFKDRSRKFNARKGFKIGEVIKLPYGLSTHITHVWENGQIQTGNIGSCHLGASGYISRSGGLDSGVKASDLIPTNETQAHNVWLFHQGFSGGNRGVYAPIEFKVYELKEDADLSGTIIPSHEKKLLQEKSETITRINGNCQPYTMHLPEIIILNGAKNIEKGETIILCGINFKSNGSSLKGQPMTILQINSLLKSKSYKAKFYSSENKYYLDHTIDIHERTVQFN